MKGVLRVMAGPHAGASLVLGKRTRIGRATDAHVQLAAPNVSRCHAQIVRVGAGSFDLVDLGSRDGTTVNGTPVQRARLHHQDLIAIGPSRFAFEYMSANFTGDSLEPALKGFDALRPTRSLPCAAQRAETTIPTRQQPIPRPTQPSAAPSPSPPTKPLPRRATSKYPSTRAMSLARIHTEKPHTRKRGSGLDVLKEVLEYRTMRLAELRGGLHSPWASREKVDTLVRPRERR